MGGDTDADFFFIKKKSTSITMRMNPSGYWIRVFSSCSYVPILRGDRKDP